MKTETRTDEVLKKLAEDITEAVAKNFSTPKESVWVGLAGYPKNRYAIGGALWSDKPPL